MDRIRNQSRFTKDWIDETEKAKWKEIVKEEVLREEDQRVLKELFLQPRGKKVFLLPSIKQVNVMDLWTSGLGTSYRLVQFGTNIIAVDRNVPNETKSQVPQRKAQEGTKQRDCSNESNGSNMKFAEVDNKRNFSRGWRVMAKKNEPMRKRHLAGKRHFFNPAIVKKEERQMKFSGFIECKITMQVDGKFHEVLRREDHLYCEKCDVKCPSSVNMSFHLGLPKHNA